MIKDLYIKGVAPSTSKGWVRPAEWLSMPDLGTTEQGFRGLLAIVPDTTTLVGVTCTVTGGYTVDWGDGTITNYASGAIATHTYDFTTITSTLTNEGYKQVIVNIYRQNTANNITSFSHAYNNETYKPNWLDVQTCLPNLTSWSSYTSLQKFVERWRFVGTTPTVSFISLLKQAANIEVFECDWSKPTGFANMLLYSGIRELGDVNATNVADAGQGLSGSRNMKLYKIGNITTNANISLTLGGLEEIGNITANGATTITFLENSNLRKVGTITSNTVTSLFRCFRTCMGLRGIIQIDCPNVTNIQELFLDCDGVEGVVFTDCALVTANENMFTNTRSLRQVIMPNLTRGFSMPNNMMSATALNDMFTSLGTASGSQTITITGNPGATTCNTSIATGKGYIVVV